MRTMDSSIELNGPTAAIEIVEFGPALRVRGVRMRFARNAEIFGEDEPADYVYRVLSGAVRTLRFSQDGRRQILGFHFPGDIFGLEPGAEHSLSAEAVSNTEIVLVRRNHIDKVAAEHPAAARAMLALSVDCLAQARDHALILGRKGAGERVAAFLLRLADRAATRGELDLPMPRADIADYLALTIETVSRTFTEMERQCAIALPSSRHVVMRDRSALAELSAA
ncbi:MAG: helix-turn-helix domain-containing protein [Hyphomonadaceae bacterium]